MPSDAPVIHNDQPVPNGGRGKGNSLLMILGALALMLLYGFFMRPRTPSPAATAKAATETDPAALGMLVEDARTRLARIRKGQETPTRVTPDAAVQGPEVRLANTRRDEGAGGGTAPVDPIKEEMRRREYQSLFAGSAVQKDKETGRSARQADPGAAQTDPDDPGGGLSSAVANGERLLAQLRQGQTPPGVPPESAAEQPISQKGDSAAKADQPPSAGTHRLFEGQIIDSVLANRLVGDLDGPVEVIVTNAVYAQDGTLVIPAGAHVLGQAKRVTAVGVTRLGVGFHRLIMPPRGGRAGVSYSLDSKALGLNQIGDVGLKDKVRHHYLSTFGAAAAIGFISGMAQSIGNQVVGSGHDNDTVVIVGGVADSTSQAAAQTLQQYTNRPWGIEITEGHRVKVYITADLDLPAYREGNSR